MCYSVLQCRISRRTRSNSAAVCCSVLQCVAVCCSVLHCTAMCWSVKCPPAPNQTALQPSWKSKLTLNSQKSARWSFYIVSWVSFFMVSWVSFCMVSWESFYIVSWVSFCMVIWVRSGLLRMSTSVVDQKSELTLNPQKSGWWVILCSKLRSELTFENAFRQCLRLRSIRNIEILNK